MTESIRGGREKKKGPGTKRKNDRVGWKNCEERESKSQMEKNKENECEAEDEAQERETRNQEKEGRG